LTGKKENVLITSGSKFPIIYQQDTGMIRIDLGTTQKEQDNSIIITILCLTIGILSADILIPLGFVVWILYLVPLLMSVWISHRYAPFFIAWLISGTLLFGSMVSEAAHSNPSDLTDRAVFILMIAIVALLAWEIKNNYASLEAEITERSSAQVRLEVLAGTLEERVTTRTRELSEVNAELTRDIEERRRVETALAMANQKLTLLSQITRHDISNRIFALLVDIDMAKDHATETHDEILSQQIASIEKTTYSIQAQVVFTKDYQEIGSQVPSWNRVEDLVRTAAEQRDTGKVRIVTELGQLEIFADPMIGKVFYNLIDNALRHGDRVTCITFSCRRELQKMIIFCEDDGIGIPQKDKESIFSKGFGRDSGLGLFLIHEILAITGITIRETGEPGKGARFELVLGEGAFRTEPDKR
jgi:signal transduction histidine kinase